MRKQKTEKTKWEIRIETIFIHLLKGGLYLLFIGIILAALFSSFVQPTIDNEQDIEINKNKECRQSVEIQKEELTEIINNQFSIVLDSIAGIQQDMQEVSKHTQGLVENQNIIINNMATSQEVKELMQNNIRVYHNPYTVEAAYEYNNK